MKLSMLCTLETLELRFVARGTCLGTDIVIIDGGGLCDRILSAVHAFRDSSERKPNRHREENDSE
jgi:hypothetical protein